MFARSGQGDEWFFDTHKFNVLYYDHNQGEYQSIKQFLDFDIDFITFLQIGFLYRDLEERLDETDDNLSELDKSDFKKAIDNCNANFFLNYPYTYF